MDLFSAIGDLANAVVGGIGDAFSGVGDLFGGGGYADINLGDPDIPMNLSGAADYVGGGIGDVWNVDVLQNFPDPVSGLDINLMDAVFNYDTAAYSGLADIGGYMGLTGDVGGFMTNAEGPVSWMGQNISPSGAPGTEAAMQGTPSGSSTGLGQGSRGPGATGASTGKSSSVVPDTMQRLANLHTATGGMMSTPPLRPGKSVSAIQMMPKLAARNTTAAQYIMHYSKVAGTKPASFKFT